MPISYQRYGLTGRRYYYPHNAYGFGLSSTLPKPSTPTDDRNNPPGGVGDGTAPNDTLPGRDEPGGTPYDPYGPYVPPGAGNEPEPSEPSYVPPQDPVTPRVPQIPKPYIPAGILPTYDTGFGTGDPADFDKAEDAGLYTGGDVGAENLAPDTTLTGGKVGVFDVPQDVMLGGKISTFDVPQTERPPAVTTPPIETDGLTPPAFVTRDPSILDLEPETGSYVYSYSPESRTEEQALRYGGYMPGVEASPTPTNLGPNPTTEPKDSFGGSKFSSRISPFDPYAPEEKYGRPSYGYRSGESIEDIAPSTQNKGYSGINTGFFDRLGTNLSQEFDEPKDYGGIIASMGLGAISAGVPGAIAGGLTAAGAKVGKAVFGSIAEPEPVPETSVPSIPAPEPTPTASIPEPTPSIPSPTPPAYTPPAPQAPSYQPGGTAPGTTSDPNMGGYGGYAPAPAPAPTPTNLGPNPTTEPAPPKTLREQQKEIAPNWNWSEYPEGPSGNFGLGGDFGTGLDLGQGASPTSAYGTGRPGSFGGAAEYGPTSQQEADSSWW